MERDRLLKVIKPKQILCDAFCGVGPLSVRAAKLGVKVLANDLNPDCYKALIKNSAINKTEKNMVCFNMDAREFIRICVGRAKIHKDNDENFDSKFPEDFRIDHFYMNLPKDALEFLDVFEGLFVGTKPTIYDPNSLPIVHVYCFAKESNSEEEIIGRARKSLNLDEDLKDYIVGIYNIRDISPRKYMYCLSFRIPPKVAYSIK